ncbi:unnamed protein product [Prunus brigantina]
MTPEAEVISTRYTKSVIKSCAALSYSEAQARMDDDSLLTDELTTDIRNMIALGKVMRKMCVRASTAASGEEKFQIDTKTAEANQMVEEFMLAANVSVALKIREHFPQFSLRLHPTPNREMLEPLVHAAAAVGLSCCMTQAVYFASGDLSLSENLHFTTPISSYADVIVHRFLAASLGIYKLPSGFQDESQFTSIADNLNCRHMSARMASWASVEHHTFSSFRMCPMDTEAPILRIRSSGFLIFVPRYGIEGYLTPRGGEWFVDEQQQKIRKMDGSILYNLHQTLSIHMEIVELQPKRWKLRLTLV